MESEDAFVIRAGRRSSWLVLVLALMVLAAAACGGVTPSPQMGVTLAMGYIPNVQFAPFYVAVEKDYFADEGLVVDFDYGMESDLLKLVAAGERSFVVGSGDQVILARAQGLPVVYVMNWYRRFPVVVFSLEPLTSPGDLRGKRVGIPGLFGASFIGWQALLYASGLDPSAVRLETIGFTQVETLLENRVDAAVGYAMNEPVQLRQMGKTVGIIDVSDYIDLVANGIITNEKTIAERPALVAGVVRAVLRGLRFTLDNPSEAFDITLKYVPEAGGENRATQMAVLGASLEYWESDQPGLSNAAAWEASQRFMRDVGLIQDVTDVNKMFTNRFVLVETEDRNAPGN